jgi:hypothetical protein
MDSGPAPSGASRNDEEKVEHNQQSPPDGQITSDLRKSVSSPKIKNISLFQKCELGYNYAHPVPIRGACHDRHERGMGRGGRW